MTGSWWRDPAARSSVSLAVIAALGIVMLVAAWHGASAESQAALQLPWLVSGGLGGITVLGASLALLNVHLERRRMAADRVSIEHVINETRRLVELLAEHRVRGRRAASVKPSTASGPSVRRSRLEPTETPSLTRR